MTDRVDIIDEWLSTLPFSKWADWDISSPDRRRFAAEWLDQQMQAFQCFDDNKALERARERHRGALVDERHAIAMTDLRYSHNPRKRLIWVVPPRRQPNAG
jgi:hypothetical protein